MHFCQEEALIDDSFDHEEVVSLLLQPKLKPEEIFLILLHAGFFTTAERYLHAGGAIDVAGGGGGDAVGGSDSGGG